MPIPMQPASSNVPGLRRTSAIGILAAVLSRFAPANTGLSASRTLTNMPIAGVTTLNRSPPTRCSQ